MSKQKAHSNQDWHRQDILAEIRKKGVSLAELGRHHGYENPTTLYNVFKAPYPKVEKIIAEFLGTQPEAIWPSRYVNKGVSKFSTTAVSTQQQVA